MGRKELNRTERQTLPLIRDGKARSGEKYGDHILVSPKLPFSVLVEFSQMPLVTQKVS